MWVRIKDELPPENEPVRTKIDDEMGLRNDQYLKRIGKLYFLLEGTTYVFYTPTHWFKC